MNDQSDTEALLKLLPPFRSTNFTNVAGWKNLLVDAGLDLWSLGQRHGVTLTCLAAMGEAGRLQLSFDRPPPRLSAELEAIKNELAEASGKC